MFKHMELKLVMVLLIIVCMNSADVMADSSANKLKIRATSFSGSGTPEGVEAKEWKKQKGLTYLPSGVRRGANPYDGSWLEYDFECPQEGDYAVWLKIKAFQAKEEKRIFVDGKELGSVFSGKNDKKLHYVRCDKPVSLKKGKHKMKIEAHGIVGQSDYMYDIVLTPDLKADLNK